MRRIERRRYPKNNPKAALALHAANAAAMLRLNTTRFLLLVCTAAWVARCLAIWFGGAAVAGFGDAGDYTAAATSLCEHGVYPDRGSLPFFRAPGLPLFLCVATFCHPAWTGLAKVALAMADTLSVVVIYFLGTGLFADERIGRLAALFATVYPFFIAQAMALQSEGLFMLLFLSAWCFFLRGMKSARGWLLFAAGLTAAGAALTRPVALVLVAIIVCSPFLYRRFTTRVRLRLCFSGALGVVLCLGPWVARNAWRYHELILVNDAAGYNFWRGTSAEMAAVQHAADPEAFRAAAVHFETVVSPRIAAEIDAQRGTPSSRSGEWRRRALLACAADPGGFLRRLLWNAWCYWRPWLNPLAYSGMVVAVSGALFLCLYSLAIVGWRRLWLLNRSAATAVAAAAALFWLAQAPFQVVSRFRIPITDPFLLILAAAACARMKLRVRLL